MDNSCDHKFVHIETIKKTGRGGYQIEYIKIDRYFCEKCLEQKEIQKREWSDQTPLWW